MFSISYEEPTISVERPSKHIASRNPLFRSLCGVRKSSLVGRDLRVQSGARRMRDDLMGRKRRKTDASHVVRKNKKNGFDHLSQTRQTDRALSTAIIAATLSSAHETDDRHVALTKHVLLSAEEIIRRLRMLRYSPRKAHRSVRLLRHYQPSST